MRFDKALLKAQKIGVRKFRDSISKFIHTHQMFVLTEHGTPTNVLLPYNDALEIVDILDELRDKDTLKAVSSGRASIKRGVKGIPASTVLKKKK